jgi:hypothetical protein
MWRIVGWASSAVSPRKPTMTIWPIRSRRAAGKGRGISRRRAALGIGTRASNSDPSWGWFERARRDAFATNVRPILARHIRRTTQKVGAINGARRHRLPMKVVHPGGMEAGAVGASSPWPFRRGGPGRLASSAASAAISVGCSSAAQGRNLGPGRDPGQHQNGSRPTAGRRKIRDQAVADHHGFGDVPPTACAATSSSSGPGLPIETGTRPEAVSTAGHDGPGPGHQALLEG